MTDVGCRSGDRFAGVVNLHVLCPRAAEAGTFAWLVFFIALRMAETEVVPWLKQIDKH